MQRRVNDAGVLVSGYPETMTAWAEGRVSYGHVRAVADAGIPLDAADRALFDRAAVAVCEAETPAGAKHLLGMLAEELAPRTLTERHQDAREDRSVRVAPLPDGMAELIVILPAVLAHAIHDRLTRQARTVTDARERARVDLAAAAAGAAAAGAAAAPSAPASTADEADGRAGSAREAASRMDGKQADTNRRPNATDPTSAEIVASDQRTMDQIRADVRADMLLTACPGILHARDQHCRFPGCRMPATRCDMDHTHDYAHGGPTEVRNLAHLCTRHHILKHATPWTVHQRDGGILQWTSPLGHTYTDETPVAGSFQEGSTTTRHADSGADPTRVRFVPDGDPPRVRFVPDGDPPPVRSLPDGDPPPF